MSAVDWLRRYNAIQQVVVDVLERGLASMEVFCENVAWHDTLLPQQPLQGRQAVAAVFNLLRTALPDMLLRVEEVISAEDYHILLYYTATGTHQGPLNGSLKIHSSPDASQQQQQQQCIPPTGKAVTWTGSIVLRMQPPPPPAAAAAAAAAAAVTAAAPGAAGSRSIQIAEGWHSWDPLFLYQQIGLAPSYSVPTAPPAAPASIAEQGREAEAAAAAHADILAAAAVPAAGLAARHDADGSWRDGCKAAVQQYFDIYNTGDFSRLPSIVHPAYHYWGLIDLQGRQGLAGMQAMMSGWRDALSRFSIGNDWMIAAEGNRVLFRWVLQGLHTKAPLRGVAAAPGPAGQARHISSCGVTALSLTQDGSDDQNWRIWRKVSHANGAELLRQLGVFEFHVTA